MDILFIFILLYLLVGVGSAIHFSRGRSQFNQVSIGGMIFIAFFWPIQFFIGRSKSNGPY